MKRFTTLISAVVLAVPVGCKCSKTPSPSATEVPVAVEAGTPNATGPKPALRCAAVVAGAEFTLGTSTGRGEDDDSGIDIPFGINVGQAIGYEGGFAVSAIDGRAGKSHAVLALFGPSAQNGKKLDLGRVYGDPDPPHLVGDSRNLVLALADMDAAGKTVRLLRVEDPLGSARLVRGSDVSVQENAATTFSVAVNGQHGLFAWEQADKKSEAVQVAFSPFLVQNLAFEKKPPTVVSSGKSDAESPRVVARNGGFWLAWLQSTSSKPALRPSTKAPVSTSGRRESKGAADEGLPAVDIGTRELYLAALDIEGHAATKELRVSEHPVHLVTYEMATLGDSSVLFAWRDDDTSPGVESQVVHVARVGLDGHVDRFRLEDESIAVGEPQLLVDPSAGEEERAWLTIGNMGEKVSLVKLLPDGNPTLPIVDDADFGVANPLVRFGGVLLVARQRTGSVDLEPLRCRFGSR